MSPALANFLVEAANFLVLAGVLGWLLFKPVRAALKAEQERRAEEETRSATTRDEANALLEQAKEANRGLQAELERRRAEMLEETRQEVADLKEQARRQHIAEERALEKKHEAALRAQSEHLADTLGRIAAASVRRLMDAVSGPSLDVALVRATCRELATIPEEARTGCVVESARPLDAESRQLLAAALGSAFEERTVPALGAGVRVTTAGGQIDGTSLNLAREAAQQIARAAGSAGAPDPGPEERRGG